MNRATYKVTTTNGTSRTLIFDEIHTENNYGNGNYITVVRLEDNELMAYLDMRYTTYVFETVCKEYINKYYGENLLEYELIKIE